MPPAVPPGPDPLSEALHSHGLVAILRARGHGPLLDAIRVLVEAGVRIVEVTIPTPGSMEAVAAAAKEFGSEVLIGTGTVLTTEDVSRTADAGGRFVVCPHTDPVVITAARASGLGSLPGAYTPTEVLTAWRCAPSAVKIFPASALGPHYVAGLAAPLPDIPVVPTGGIGVDDIAAYRGAGAVAVGVSSPLIGDALSGGSLTELHHRARRYVLASGDHTS
ncbi:bifunctional 4-hydroxy-2-oxoglutarate aldolase/2-dehydro-3-deoxy-phosphogluconate aldolase [Streptomyces sp. NBC_01012]|uniref:bifunctional 4-hydroxy-2-oxoglutarate aldolase/2-dehydro-3-deoxy-phosphogluconate aldolase n=1 Tax=Streptomyces sp. NBC_01012 TaxID=2903717 RepID=UPI00386F738F|nr:bifunctional 4-hydroxy-2-oxoglutarate aldolase/2-dehydro-3-deoxy-phosphogluconate aldolase [Streptomyces sp. NBC_01012]